VFGSPADADDASDVLLHALGAGVVVTGALAPSGPDAGAWIAAKARGAVVEGGGLVLVKYATQAAKDATARERPDHSDEESLPSGHSSLAFASARLVHRNLGAIPMRPGTRRALQAGAYTMAAGTAWARVEAGRHYPSDVLAGAALGNLLAVFVHDAFMNLPEDGATRVSVVPGPSGVQLRVSRRF
jgi:membrane-associated phospholipid phosphatase